ncbi:alpha/beta hydrolase [Breoghania sp. L-A4]|uniref:RBBP9/YdeN family alpha/beta hydrolase n=1 Tax=Breoghania sp. L-A4 TaxID=2304600 RepID=UPI000E3598D7|nr:alpha/beta hydrolase [Breoghania sp. L-A4]AXS41160.1 serine hydrolase family protein [Breoghania sp. L-A4]
MKIAHSEILIVPGLGNSGPDHWQTRWETKLSTAKRVEMGNWDRPHREQWTERLVTAVNAAQRPVVLVGHSLGVVTIAHAAPKFDRGKVAGAYCVALPDIEDASRVPAPTPGFGPIPREKLPFACTLVASQTDPYCPYPKAERIAAEWGAHFESAGDCGHINADSGQGPWPEGLLSFAKFMTRLG